MNLADMLCYADIEELGRIARTYSCECSSNSKNELIQSILTTVSRKDVFEQQMSQLEDAEIRFLNALLFDRRDSFSLEELMARASSTTGDRKETEETAPAVNPRELITRFKRRGWLFQGYSHQTKLLFRVPEDMKKRFGETLTEHFSRSVYRAEIPPRVYRDEQQLLQDDLFQFLKRVAEQDMPLNAEGYLYKRQVQQIIDHFAVQEEPVGKTAWRFGYGRRFKEYPSRFSFLYDYGYYHGLLEEKGASLQLTETGGEFLAAGRGKDHQASIYAFWLRLYRRPIPNLPSLAHWIERLCKNWTTTESLQGILCRLIKPYYYDTPEAIYRERVLRMMMHLGLLRIGSDETRGEVIQMTKLGSALITGTYVPEEEAIDLPIDSR